MTGLWHNRKHLSRLSSQANDRVSELRKVTIMIPTYNQGSMICDAIESALKMDYPELEVVVADDASTDDTASRVQRYTKDSRFRYFRNDRNLGRVANYRETLYHRVTGNWVLNLDGDDSLDDSHFLSDTMCLLREARSVVLVVGGCRVVYSNGSFIDMLPTDEPYQVKNGVDFFLGWTNSSVVPHLGALYRRDLALRLGFYSHPILSADWESLRKLTLHGQVLLLGRTVGTWRIHGMNASKSVDINEHVENLKSITEPYAYALQLGVPKSALSRWKRRALRAYISSTVQTFVSEASFVPSLRWLRASFTLHRLATLRAILSICLDPRFFGKVILSVIGGPELVERERGVWRRLRQRYRHQ